MESRPECLALFLVRSLARLKAEVLPDANRLKCCAKLSLGHLHQFGASRLPEFVQHRWIEKTGHFPNLVCAPDCNFKRRIFCRLIARGSAALALFAGALSTLAHHTIRRRRGLTVARIESSFHLRWETESATGSAPFTPGRSVIRLSMNGFVRSG